MAMIDRRTTLASFVALTLDPAPAESRTGSAKSITVRPSQVEDVPAMVEMIERRRLRYQAYQPVFWRKAANSAQASLSWFAQMLEAGVVAFTALENGRVAGFVFANETREPPVVDPGGKTVSLDDYCVADEGRWPDVGRALLEAVKSAGRTKGWRQIVVISAEADMAKSRFLHANGLSIASTWWTTPI
jgi:L-amino acid N-acyltransferase YncA